MQYTHLQIHYILRSLYIQFWRSYNGTILVFGNFEANSIRKLNARGDGIGVFIIESIVFESFDKPNCATPSHVTSESIHYHKRELNS